MASSGKQKTTWAKRTRESKLREKRDAMMRFGRASVEAIHYFKNNKPQTIAILKKYAKSDLSTLDSAYAYLKNVQSQ